MYLLTISIQKYWPQFIKFKNQRDKKGQDLFYLGFLYMLSLCVFFFFELQSLSPVLIFKMPIWHSIWISNRHLNMHVQKFSSVQFSSCQLLSHVRLFVTSWIAACQASLSITNSRSLIKLTSIESAMPSSHLILCHPLLLLLSTPPSIRVFCNESTLCMRWPKYWSFSFSIIPSKEYPGLISFRMDWLDLLAVQGTLKSFLFVRYSSEKPHIWPRSLTPSSVYSALSQRVPYYSNAFPLHSFNIYSFLLNGTSQTLWWVHIWSSLFPTDL